jgi:uroporphyrin-III C-methyltransferase
VRVLVVDESRGRARAFLRAEAAQLFGDLLDGRVPEVHLGAMLLAYRIKGESIDELAFIEKLMVRLAQRGQVAARVKGGDRFVFGRGGEELLVLRAAGIEVEVASGITAGIATLPDIVAGLRAGGLPADTPAAAIQNGTRVNARELRTTLWRLRLDVAAAEIGSPAVLVIGAMCDLAAAAALPQRALALA